MKSMTWAQAALSRTQRMPSYDSWMRGDSGSREVKGKELEDLRKSRDNFIAEYKKSKERAAE